MGQVELSEGEARSLYQRLDSDRDGALGAEDLLRGAHVIGRVSLHLSMGTCQMHQTRKIR